MRIKLAWVSVKVTPIARKDSPMRSRSATVSAIRRDIGPWCRMASSAAAWATLDVLNGWRTRSIAATQSVLPTP